MLCALAAAVLLEGAGSRAVKLSVMQKQDAVQLETFSAVHK